MTLQGTEILFESGFTERSNKCLFLIFKVFNLGGKKESELQSENFELAFEKEKIDTEEKMTHHKVLPKHEDWVQVTGYTF